MRDEKPDKIVHDQEWGMRTTSTVRWVLGAYLLVASGCPGSVGESPADGLADGGGADSEAALDAARDVRDGGGDDVVEVADPAPSRCGDGVVDPDEDCDDGNRLDGDDFDWRCRRGAGDPPSHSPDDVGGVEVAIPLAPMEGTWSGLGGASESQHLPLEWADAEYASVWIDVVAMGEPFGHFWRFDRNGRRTGVEWTYAYPGREFGTWDLAWSGEFFGLVWCPLDDGPLSFAVLDWSGKPVVGPLDLVDEAAQCTTAIAWDGEAFAVAWASPPAHQFTFKRIDETGEIRTDSVGLDIPAPGTLASWALDASTAATVILFTQDPGSPRCSGTAEGACVRWIALADDGSVLHGPRNLGAAWGWDLDIAWDGSAFAGAFEAGNADGHGGLYIATMGPRGELLGPPHIPLTAPGGSAVAICGGLGGWTVAHLRGERGGGGAIIRTDRTGIRVNDIAMDTTLLHFAALGLAFDGEAFGLLGMGEAGPVFARYVVVP